jgi:hypothetical protein
MGKPTNLACFSMDIFSAPSSSLVLQIVWETLWFKVLQLLPN